MSRYVFVSAPTFEPWSYENPDRVGIGGSETSHIEMAQRLARRGHEVISYAPTPFLKREHEGVLWLQFRGAEQAEWNKHKPDVYVIYRAPELLDHLPADANAWLICQDVDYPQLTPERSRRFSRIVALCKTQASYLRIAHPEAADRVCVSSNGIKTEYVEKLLADPPARSPRRMMYASSPDRGMGTLLEIFPRIRESVSDAELHVFYGFDNIEKVIAYAGEKSPVARTTARLRELLEQPGVTWHGRTGQPELLREWFQSGIWCHPSNFTETSCITCMDAQACGAIPVTSPVWAIAENVKHGVFVEGDATSDLIKARYVHQVTSLMWQPELQEEIRVEMMPWALQRFGWEKFVGQWQNWAQADVKREVAA